MNESRQSVLFLVPGLGPDEEGASIRTLALALSSDQFRISIGVLGRIDKSESNGLGTAGITVLSMSIRHTLDVAGARRVRQLARECGPVIVHAWGAAAARAARAIVADDALGGNAPRLVISGASKPGGGLGGWLTARRLRRADRVIPWTRAEGDRYRRLRVPAEKLTLISPAAPFVDNNPIAEPDQRTLSPPLGGRVLVASGRAEQGVGPRDAIIAFDMLRYDHRDLQLAILGAGPETTSLERFARTLAFDDLRVHFLERISRLAEPTQRATAVFVTRPRLGIEDALEGMAAGKPVVGWATPDLAEVVEDKVSGLLVPFGDRAALAASMRAVLENPSYARRLGEAGRRRAIERFGLERMVEQFARLYREIAPSIPADRSKPP